MTTIKDIINDAVQEAVKETREAEQIADAQERRAYLQEALDILIDRAAETIKERIVG